MQILGQPVLGGMNHGEQRFVCMDCFADYAIRAFVNSRAESRWCSYCLQESDRKIGARIGIVLEFIRKGLEEFAFTMDPWSAEAALANNPSARAVYAEFFPGTPRRLLWDLINGLQDEVSLATLIVRPVAPEWLTHSWTTFSNQVKHECRFVFYRWRARQKLGDAHAPFRLLDEIGGYVKALEMVKPLPPGTCIYRARQHAADIPKTAKELGAPPPFVASQSRMSPAGIPMFYGASSENVAVQEVIRNDPRKENMTVAKFRTLRSLQILDLAKPPPAPSLFDRRRLRLRAAAVFMQEFSRELSKPIIRDGAEQIDYVPSQIVAEYFPEFDLENAHYGLFQGIGEVDFA
jgi:hypothetical protein